MKIILHILSSEIETLTCEMSSLLQFYTDTFLPVQLRPGLCLVLPYLEQVKSLLMAWYCGFTQACRSLKEFLVYDNLLCCPF